MPIRPAGAQSISTNSVHSAHGESADDSARRVQQRHLLALLMTGLVVLAAVYLWRKSKNPARDTGI